MGIKDIGNNPGQNNPPTTEERQARTKKRLVKRGQDLLDHVTQAHNEIVKLVWEHPVLSPAEVVAGLGTDGGH